MTRTGADRSFSSAQAGSADLPHVVRIRGWPLAGAVTGYGRMLAVLLGLAAMVWMRERARLEAIAGLLGLAAGCAWRLWMLSRPYLVLYPDRFEKRELIRWRTQTRADIEGTRSADGDKWGMMFEVVPKTAGRRGVILREEVRADPIVHRWFVGLRDLTAEALAEDRQSVLADAGYGRTAAERAARLKRAKAVVIAFTAACLGLGGWIMLTPGAHLAHQFAAAAALAVGAALVRTSKGLIVWLRGRERPAAVGALVPFAAASWLALPLHILHPEPLMVAAGAAGMLLALSSLRGEGWRNSAVIGLFAGLLIYGCAKLFDVALAPPQVRVFPSMVLDRHAIDGGAPVNDLSLAPWDDQPASVQAVPASLFAAARIGTTVCVYRRSGALGLDWFDIDRCPGAPKP